MTRAYDLIAWTDSRDFNPRGYLTGRMGIVATLRSSLPVEDDDKVWIVERVNSALAANLPVDYVSLIELF